MNAIKEARYNLAIAYLNDAQYNEAIPEFEAVLNIDTDFIEAHCGLSRAYLELQELDKAEISAQKALSLNSDHTSALSLIDELKNAHYDSGIKSLTAKRYREAVSTFEKVGTLDSNFKQTHYNLGRAYIGLRQYDKAITSLQSSIDTDSASEDVHYHIGCAYIEQRLFDKSIQHLEEAVNTDPNLKDAHYHLACAYRETGNLEAATNAVTETLRLDPDYKPVHELVEKIKQTHYNRGKSYLNNSRYSDAIAAFQNVITLDSDFTAAHFDLGVAYLKLENFARAVDVLQKTVALDRTHKAALHALALAYFGLHELENARNAAKDALQIDPNYQPAKSLLEAIDPNFTDIPIDDTSEEQDATPEQEIDIPETQPTEQTQQEDESDSQSTTEEPDTPVPEKTDIQKDLDRGLIFLSNNQYNNAAAAYKKVIKADPNCIDAHYGLGQTYLEVGAFDDAKSAAEEALKLDPRHKPSLELLEAITYFINLDRNRKKWKKVFTFVSIFLIIGIGVFAGWYFFWSVPQPPPPPPKLNPKPPKPNPPVLSIQSSLIEPSGNGFIDAGEDVTLKIVINNNGGNAENIKISLKPSSLSGLQYSIPTDRIDVRHNQRKTINIPITAKMDVKAQTKSLTIQLLTGNNRILKTKKFDFKTQPGRIEPEPVR